MQGWVRGLVTQGTFEAGIARGFSFDFFYFFGKGEGGGVNVYRASRNRPRENIVTARA